GREWPTLSGRSVRSRYEEYRGGRRDAAEDSHGGAIRTDPTGVRVRDRHDPRRGPAVRRASPAGARSGAERGAPAEGAAGASPPAAGAGGRGHRRDPGSGSPGAAQTTAHGPPDLRAAAAGTPRAPDRGAHRPALRPGG